jgi:hypothetical protein
MRAVEIPGEAGAALAAARFMIGHVGTCAWIVGLLHLECNETVLHMDLPGASAGAVDAMGGAHHFVETPPVTIPLFPLPWFVGDDTVAVRKALFWRFEEFQSFEKMAHI